MGMTPPGGAPKAPTMQTMGGLGQGMGFKDWRQQYGMQGAGRGLNRALFNSGWQPGQAMPGGLNQRQQQRFGNLAGAMMPRPQVSPMPSMGGPPQIDAGFGNGVGYNGQPTVPGAGGMGNIFASQLGQPGTPFGASFGGQQPAPGQPLTPEQIRMRMGG